MQRQSLDVPLRLNIATPNQDVRWYSSSHVRRRKTDPMQERFDATARTHKVRRGETLTGIARRYRVSLTALKRANSIRNEHALMAGTRLRIPG